MSVGISTFCLKNLTNFGFFGRFGLAQTLRILHHLSVEVSHETH
jgi:hypothetical protein